MMTKHSPSRSAALATGALVVLAVATAAAPAAQGGAGRVCEPVVLAGTQLTPLLGATRDELSLWTRRDGSWQRAPLQMDERATGGNYVPAEDGLLDQDDELVFLADGLGAEAPAGSWPPGVGRAYSGLEV